MKRKKTKIVLTGYRACGKTSVGEKLAERLAFSFIDTDREIEKRQGRSISRIVAEQGWDFFRAAERDFLASLLPAEKLVIAPGGGAILHQDIWRELMATSLVVWLKADVRTISRRLTGDILSPDQRPSLTGEDVLQEVKTVLAAREPLYRAGSHVAVDAEKPIGQVVDEIEALWMAAV
ncbi:MAG: shikimate kinase [Deltaproteobacteria bacterium]|nr:shikimate kinase [Deltaproteobacteria bacterium]